MVTDNSLLAPRRFEVRYFSLLAEGYQQAYFRDIIGLKSTQTRRTHAFYLTESNAGSLKQLFNYHGPYFVHFPKPHPFAHRVFLFFFTYSHAASCCGHWQDNNVRVMFLFASCGWECLCV